MAEEGGVSIPNESDEAGRSHSKIQYAKRSMSIFRHITESLREDEVGEIKTMISDVLRLGKNKNDETSQQLRAIYCRFLSMVQFRPGISVHMMKQAIRAFLLMQEDVEGLGAEVYRRFIVMLLKEYPSLVVNMHMSDELIKIYFKLLSEGHDLARQIRPLLARYGIRKSLLARRHFTRH